MLRFAKLLVKPRERNNLLNHALDIVFYFVYPLDGYSSSALAEQALTCRKRKNVDSGVLWPYFIYFKIGIKHLYDEAKEGLFEKVLNVCVKDCYQIDEEPVRCC
jgi:hypothetical protein